MIGDGFAGWVFFLLLSLWLWSGMCLGQPTRSQINYKLVPNLEPMKDQSPTPDFTLSDPAGKQLSLKGVGTC